MAPDPSTPRRPGLLRSATSSLRRWLAGRSTAPHAGVPSGYPGDFTGRLVPAYDPNPDGRPDPGEIVWTWVPFEEDHRQGKDRPVLLVGHDGPWLLGAAAHQQGPRRLPVTATGRRWVDIGSGAWDRQGRPSEVRVDRVVRVDPRGGAPRGRGARRGSASTPWRAPWPTCTAERPPSGRHRGRRDGARHRRSVTGPVGVADGQRPAAFLAIEDFLFAAWFLWMTPLLTALSSLVEATARAAFASSALPESAASRNLRIAVLNSDLIALLRSVASAVRLDPLELGLDVCHV